VLVRALLAPTCASCAALLSRPLGGPICDECWLAVPRLTPPCCVRCGDALIGWRPIDPCCERCRRTAPMVTLTRSAGRHDGSLRRIIHTFKYSGRRVLAAPLARLMQEAGDGVMSGADAVVPVPLHPWRQWQRGFNQADDLACRLGPPVWRVLRRRRHGPPQAGLPAAQRQTNVQDAFALCRWPFARAQLRNRSVVLVDDVMTTGATLEACARVLIEAGARSVCALTVARAVSGAKLP